MLKRFWFWLWSLFQPKPKNMSEELELLIKQASRRMMDFDDSAKHKTPEQDQSDLPPEKRVFRADVQGVPIFLPVEIVGPQIDPVKWGEYVSIKTSNAHKTEEWPQGWRGTITENIEFTFAHNLAKLIGLDIGKFENVLNVHPYEWNENGARVDYSLNHCVEGGLTCDEGGLTVEPQAWGGCLVGCQKNLMFEKGSDWLKPEVVWGLQFSMQFVVFMWVVEYSLKIMLRALAEDPSLENSQAMHQAKDFYHKVLDADEPLEAFNNNKMH